MKKVTFSKREELERKYINNNLSFNDVKQYFNDDIKPFTYNDQNISKTFIKNVVMSSDGFIPFKDNIEQANKHGVNYIANPGGSISDNIIIDECNKRFISMFNTGLRMFYH